MMCSDTQSVNKKTMRYQILQWDISVVKADTHSAGERTRVGVSHRSRR